MVHWLLKGFQERLALTLELSVCLLQTHILLCLLFHFWADLQQFFTNLVQLGLDCFQFYTSSRVSGYITLQFLNDLCLLIIFFLQFLVLLLNATQCLTLIANLHIESFDKLSLFLSVFTYLCFGSFILINDLLRFDLFVLELISYFLQILTIFLQLFLQELHLLLFLLCFCVFEW